MSFIRLELLGQNVVEVLFRYPVESYILWDLAISSTVCIWEENTLISVLKCVLGHSASATTAREVSQR